MSVQDYLHAEKIQRYKQERVLLYIRGNSEKKNKKSSFAKTSAGLGEDDSMMRGKRRKMEQRVCAEYFTVHLYSCLFIFPPHLNGSMDPRIRVQVLGAVIIIIIVIIATKQINAPV